MFKAAEPGCLFTSKAGMHTRYLNSISALIVPGNCSVEGSRSVERLARVQRVGRAHYNKPHWDHYQFMPVTLRLAADGGERALLPSDWDGPLPGLLSGNIGMATGVQPLQVDHRFASNGSNSHPWRLSGISSVIPIFTPKMSPFIRNMTLIALQL